MHGNTEKRHLTEVILIRLKGKFNSKMYVRVGFFPLLNLMLRHCCSPFFWWLYNDYILHTYVHIYGESKFQYKTNTKCSRTEGIKQNRNMDPGWSLGFQLPKLVYHLMLFWVESFTNFRLNHAMYKATFFLRNFIWTTTVSKLDWSEKCLIPVV